MDDAAFDPKHPLLSDMPRLEGVTDLMYATIHKTLFAVRPRRGNRPPDERILPATAVSADDVLQHALEALLKYPVARLNGTWEALGIGIAHKKAVDAIRREQAGLRGTEHRSPLRLVSTDAPQSTQDERSTSLLDLPDDAINPEEACVEMDRALKLRDFALDVLDERSLRIFFGVHFEGRHCAEIGEVLGLTGQRVGQLYRDAYECIAAHPGNPFKAEQSSQGGTDDRPIPRPR